MARVSWFSVRLNYHPDMQGAARAATIPAAVGSDSIALALSRI